MKKLLAIALTLLLAYAVSGKTAHYALSNKDGLSNNSVNCVCQDSDGQMWIGTWEGLNMYNSSGFRIWKASPADENTLSSNIIRHVAEQSPGIIWAATDYGINRIDVGTGEIRRFMLGYEYKNPASDETFNLSVSSSRRVFCSAFGWGVAFYDEKNDRMEAFNIPEMNTSDITEIYCAGDDRLLLISSGGKVAHVRYSFSANGEILITEKGELLDEPVESSFSCDSSIFLVTRDTLFIYDSQDGGKESFRLPMQGEVRAVTRGQSGEIFIAFYELGVIRYDTASGTHTPVPELSDVNIFSLYYGTQNILWAATDGQGLWAVYEDEFRMNKVSSAIMFESGRAPVRSFFKAGDLLYVGTKGNGIFVMDGQDRLVRKYDRSSGLSDNAVYAFAAGYDNDIFVGTNGCGIDAISLKTGKITHILPEEDKMFSSVYDIQVDHENGCVWLGTYGCGLIRLELRKENGKYRITGQTTFINDKNDSLSVNSNIVFPLLKQGADILWVGTKGGGLDRLDLRDGVFRHFTVSSAGGGNISSNDVSALFFGRDSTLWVGTSYGLNRVVSYRDGRCVFESFTDADGLPNNSIHGIDEDSRGNLWISTSTGLSVYDINGRSFRNYYNDEALQNNEYADGAHLRSGETVWFGGVDGYNSFNPDEISPRTFVPKVIIGSVDIHGGPEFRPSRKNGISLKAGENFFEIGFSAIEYINNSNCKYAYKLDGFNSDWVYTDSRTANFTNVPPGKYVFMVRSTNGDKIWNDSISSLDIKISSPWYATPWAFIVYFIALATLFYAAWKIYDERMQHKHFLELESLNKKRLVDTYEAKLTFFTNIAHEFMTPLTLILGPIEQMMTGLYRFPNKVEKYHRIIHGNAERMRRLISELIEFRRTDTDNSVPEYSLVNISEIMKAVTDNFSEMNEQMMISLKASIPEGITIVTDGNAVEKIFYNLISNAYKYTSEGGDIEIRLADGPESISVSVTNSGKGISHENLDKVFDRFVILDNYESAAVRGGVVRNGIGLALVHSLVKMLSGKISVSSIEGKSTTFDLCLPKLDPSMISASVRNAPAPDSGTEENASRGSLAPADQTSGNTIMIVDDEKEIRDLVNDVLSDQYEIIEAENGAAAAELLKHVRPDLIITDLNMPQMDGIGLLKYVKNNEITRHIPLIILAYRSDIETETEAYELGSESFVSKPFSTNHLCAVVRQVLNSRSVLKEYYNSAVSQTDVWRGNIVDASDKNFIVKMTKLIEENLSDGQLSLDMLCDRMAVSRPAMYRKIKDMTGSTPTEFVRRVKLNRASMLLRTTALTVQEIMYASGFNNKAYFHKEFSKIYGMSPKEYRKNVSARANPD